MVEVSVNLDGVVVEEAATTSVAVTEETTTTTTTTVTTSESISVTLSPQPAASAATPSALSPAHEQELKFAMQTGVRKPVMTTLPKLSSQSQLEMMALVKKGELSSEAALVWAEERSRYEAANPPIQEAVAVTAAVPAVAVKPVKHDKKKSAISILSGALRNYSKSKSSDVCHHVLNHNTLTLPRHRPQALLTRAHPQRASKTLLK